MNRAQRRAEKKSKKKKGQKPNEEIDKKMGLFDLLPDQCSACLAPYDKKDKQMATTWNVVVKEEAKIVRLYCPDCWSTAQRILQDVRDNDAK
tara:strand:- start:513 stop:788 length:276 start_codon:yes stop_codon:yes gene_type:complete